MISGQSLFSAAQIVALGTLFPLFPAHPFSVWSNAYNTGALSTSLQQWRALGRHYLYTDRKSSWYAIALYSLHLVHDWNKTRAWMHLYAPIRSVLQAAECVLH